MPLVYPASCKLVPYVWWRAVTKLEIVGQLVDLVYDEEVLQKKTWYLFPTFNDQLKSQRSGIGLEQPKSDRKSKS